MDNIVSDVCCKWLCFLIFFLIFRHLLYHILDNHPINFFKFVLYSAFQLVLTCCFLPCLIHFIIEIYSRFLNQTRFGNFFMEKWINQLVSYFTLRKIAMLDQNKILSVLLLSMNFLSFSQHLKT
jgi:hypothetical protein